MAANGRSALRKQKYSPAIGFKVGFTKGIVSDFWRDEIMELTIVNKDANMIEVEVDVDKSLLGWLVEKLNGDKSVEFAT